MIHDAICLVLGAKESQKAPRNRQSLQRGYPQHEGAAEKIGYQRQSLYKRNEIYSSRFCSTSEDVGCTRMQEETSPKP